ncbi:hypothetical protein LWI28_020057 [Acer negundo]|uniref:Uncharacterized protein n=1 Tax=Acer negundo TaxID=4023 RepID=A0AAD5J0N6_ACENE|nr:hypothetical protein LWI28_020057 [Acer negundo]
MLSKWEEERLNGGVDLRENCCPDGGVLSHGGSGCEGGKAASASSSVVDMEGSPSASPPVVATTIRLGMCIELVKMAIEFVMVVAEAVSIVIHHDVTPQEFSNHSYTAAVPFIGFLP